MGAIWVPYKDGDSPSPAAPSTAGLDIAKTNVCGGAIALGHPLGASGARITSPLAHALAAGRAKTAIGSACIGGGQGVALAVEAP